MTEAALTTNNPQQSADGERARLERDLAEVRAERDNQTEMKEAHRKAWEHAKAQRDSAMGALRRARAELADAPDPCDEGQCFHLDVLAILDAALSGNAAPVAPPAEHPACSRCNRLVACRETEPPHSHYCVRCQQVWDVGKVESGQDEIKPPAEHPAVGVLAELVAIHDRMAITSRSRVWVSDDERAGFGEKLDALMSKARSVLSGESMASVVEDRHVSNDLLRTGIQDAVKALHEIRTETQAANGKTRAAIRRLNAALDEDDLARSLLSAHGRGT